MQTIAQRSTPVQHYAENHGGYGVATLMSGGYLFQPDASRDAWLVSYKDPDLMLFGLVSLAEETDTRPLWQQALVRTASAALAGEEL